MDSTISSREQNSNKQFIKNIVIVIISNLFSAVSGILIGFIIPKVLSIGDYGYYKTFTLYSTYIGLLHFGFIDGIYLKFAGQKYEDLNKEKFRTYTKFLIFIELAFSIISMLVSLFFLNTSTFYIFLFVGMNIFLTNMLSYFEFICQATMRFKQRSIRKVILCLLNIVSVVAIYLIYKYTNYAISGLIYIEITCFISLIILIWYMVTYRHIIFGKSAPLKEEKDNIIFFFRAGILLLFANLVSQFVFAVDQQFINLLFDEETYATYAFAYNMINVILIATSAISVVFFPTIKKYSQEELISNYSIINSYFLIFVSFCLISYYPLELIVRFFLDKYIPSLPIFLVVLPGAVISSSITSIKYNCYKALNIIKSFFIISLIILIVSIGADAAVYFIFGKPISLAIASIVVMLIWYLVSDIYFSKKYKSRWIKNFLYLVSIIGAFYGISFIGNLYVELGVFFIAYLLITYAFFFRIINKGCSGFMKKTKRNKAKKEINENLKILITGGNGQLGKDCFIELQSRGYKFIKPVDVNEMDITDAKSVNNEFEKYQPDVVIHCAAWTAVDKAEDFPEKVFEVNADGTKNIACACKNVGAKMIYISTDYVFDGLGKEPFEIDSPKNGLSVYGKSKSQGEDNVIETLNRYFIVRISWAFGVYGNNFVNTMIKLADMGKKELNVVSDQIGSVTFTRDLSKLLADMLETEKYGIYHATNEGFISWADFAKKIFEIKNKDVIVNPVSTEDYKKINPNQADRPLNSRLSKVSLDQAGFSRLPNWEDALKRYLEEISKFTVADVLEGKDKNSNVVVKDKEGNTLMDSKIVDALASSYSSCHIFDPIYFDQTIQKFVLFINS